MRRPIHPLVAVVVIVLALVLLGVGIWWRQRPSGTPPVITTPPATDIPPPVQPAR